MTVVKMREHLKDIDFSGRTKLSFIEYLMFKYHKTLAQLFAPPPAVPSPATPNSADVALHLKFI